jgi:hypothetical protein
VLMSAHYQNHQLPKEIHWHTIYMQPQPRETTHHLSGCHE